MVFVSFVMIIHAAGLENVAHHFPLLSSFGYVVFSKNE